MKTLKKTLCLVLAVVMAVGVLVLPAYAVDTTAAVTTAADADATAAFAALKMYGVVRGVDAAGDGDLGRNVHREDVAAIVYRIMTGDTTETQLKNYEKYADDYADSATFSKWSKGYIGYAAVNDIFVGDAQGNFKPKDDVTGRELVIVLLRCIGYGQNHEFEGANWSKNALAQAQAINMFGGTGRYTVSTDMKNAISRGVVMKLVSNAVKTPRVTYYSGAYSNHKDMARPSLNNNGQADINTPLIDVTSVGGATEAGVNDWGIPYSAVTEKTVTWTFTNPVVAVSGSTKIPASSKLDTPLYDSFTYEDHCDVADKAGIKADAVALTYLNGKAGANLTIDVSDEDTIIGTNGRHTLLYANTDANTKEAAPYVLVQIDTYLAVVTSVATSSKVVDKNGHVIVESKTNGSVAVYVNNQKTVPLALAATLPDGSKVGDLVLVNVNEKAAAAVMSDPTVAAADVTVCAPKTATVTVKEITKGHNGVENIIGFVDTTGHQYYYSNTFCGDKLQENAIGKGTYTLVLDRQGYVLDCALVTTTDSNFGVVTGSKVVTLEDDKGYVIQLTLLDPEGKTVTVNVGDYDTAGKPWADKADATAEMNNIFGVGYLIHYTLGTGGYYCDTSKGYTNGLTTPTESAVNKVVPGRVDITDTYGADFVRGTAGAQGFLVNDDTIIFVAQNVIDNTTIDDKNDYKFVGYALYSFKNLPILTVENGVSAITGMPGFSVSQVSLQALTAAGKAPAAGEYAKYVVINGSTKQITTPEKIDTINYAFIFGNSEMKQVGDSYFTFQAYVNGGKTPIKVSLNAGNGVVANGLYAYGTAVNVNGEIAYTEVTLMDGNSGFASPYGASFKIAKNGFNYSKGVLTDTANNVFYNVASNCKVYTVAPNANEGREIVNGVAELNAYADHDIWYQLDELGNISLIYVDMSK